MTNPPHSPRQGFLTAAVALGAVATFPALLALHFLTEMERRQGKTFPGS